MIEDQKAKHLDTGLFLDLKVCFFIFSSFNTFLIRWLSLPLAKLSSFCFYAAAAAAVCSVVLRSVRSNLLNATFDSPESTQPPTYPIQKHKSSMNHKYRFG